MSDGMVPKRFRRRHARMPAALDLNSIVKAGTAKISTDLVGKLKELVAAVNVTLSAKLKMNSVFWRQMFDRQDLDTGFVHFSSAGTFDGSAAVLEIACGQLGIYQLDDMFSKDPYEKQLYVAELVNVKQSDDLFIPRAVNVKWKGKTQKCLHIMTKTEWLNKQNKHFCPVNVDDVPLLQEALTLQFRRFRNFRAAEAAAQEADKEAVAEAISAGYALKDVKVTMIHRKVQRDTTWFREGMPLDISSWLPFQPPPASLEEVQTPLQRWAAAIAATHQEGSNFLDDIFSW